MLIFNLHFIVQYFLFIFAIFPVIHFLLALMAVCRYPVSPEPNYQYPLTL
ncbi:GSCOCG00004815001-RA-CDS [Cotesia congregata]|nr:GSCOCG00004815001-RA-CDS [Cotesia congregata]